MATDQKKVQTLVNIVGQQAQIARDAVTTMENMRALYNTHNPDVTGTPLQGNLSAVNAAINSLRSAVDDAAFDLMVNSVVPSHRNKGLE